mmetsp:Transcript_21489/g.37869  ORF Transcript_21489/g.37869 Transcript_21489/m.37869 type:complete len:228 (-) Transcript_21489:228-911(-)
MEHLHRPWHGHHASMMAHAGSHHHHVMTGHHAIAHGPHHSCHARVHSWVHGHPRIHAKHSRLLAHHCSWVALASVPISILLLLLLLLLLMPLILPAMLLGGLESRYLNRLLQCVAFAVLLPSSLVLLLFLLLWPRARDGCDEGCGSDRRGSPPVSALFLLSLPSLPLALCINHAGGRRALRPRRPKGGLLGGCVRLANARSLGDRVAGGLQLVLHSCGHRCSPTFSP